MNIEWKKVILLKLPEYNLAKTLHCLSLMITSYVISLDGHNVVLVPLARKKLSTFIK